MYIHRNTEDVHTDSAKCVILKCCSKCCRNPFKFATIAYRIGKNEESHMKTLSED